MKFRLAVATLDKRYAEHLSGLLSEKFADSFEVVVFTQPERLEAVLKTTSFDAALLDSDFLSVSNLSASRILIVLTEENEQVSAGTLDVKQIRKYQRISSMASDIMELLSEIPSGMSGISSGDRGNITVVWSPAGGTGKTTVALAYAINKVSSGKQALYLNLENFTSTTAYFRSDGKSISKAFESLDSGETNVRLLLKGMRQQDSITGIFYFNEPENIEDMNILSPDDVEALALACAAEADELVVDLSSQYNACIGKFFDLASRVFIVTDASSTSQVKLRQFIRQHNVFGRIRTKATLICNKGSQSSEADLGKRIYLTRVQTSDPPAVARALSMNVFD